MSDDAVLDAVRAAGAVCVLRLREHGRVAALAEALAGGGLPVMELTLDDPGALPALRRLAADPPPGGVVGAGTVRSAEDVRAAADAGARFVVSPGLHDGVVETALELGIEPLPGAATATEVAEALRRGARLVKLFPAGPLGVPYLQALRGPFGDVSFVPTGGIAHTAVATWLRAGAVAVGLGSDLVGPAPTAEDVAAVRARAERVAAQVAEVRADG